MKIITWNLNHRTRVKKLPSGICDFLQSYSPDVVAFNEYVDAPSRKGFYEGLGKLGYSFIELSEPTEGNNQVLICSKIPMVRGSISPPQYDSAAISNFLHVNFPEQDINVVGIRAPAYTSKLHKEAYWSQVAEIAGATEDKKTIFLGDLNFDPFVGISRTVPKVEFALKSGFYVPNPEGEWSFISTNGQRSSRIDHAIVSNSLTVTEAKYLAEWQGIVLAGPKDKSPITDHAVLSVSVENV